MKMVAMQIKSKTLNFETKPETDLVNITKEVEDFVHESGLKNGNVTVFVVGSTASVSTIEFEPNLVDDFKQALERLVPSDIKYKHTETWGDENGKSHVRATLMGPSITIPFVGGKLMLGTWQQVAVIDMDVPARKREVILQIIGE